MQKQAQLHNMYIVHWHLQLYGFTFCLIGTQPQELYPNQAKGRAIELYMYVHVSIVWKSVCCFYHQHYASFKAHYAQRVSSSTDPMGNHPHQCKGRHTYMYMYIYTLCICTYNSRALPSARLGHNPLLEPLGCVPIKQKAKP